jgi:hypothetical protein
MQAPSQSVQCSSSFQAPRAGSMSQPLQTSMSRPVQATPFMYTSASMSRPALQTSMSRPVLQTSMSRPVNTGSFQKQLYTPAETVVPTAWDATNAATAHARQLEYA